MKAHNPSLILQARLQMIFLDEQPFLVQLLPSHKIVLATSHHLIFANSFQLQQHLSTKLRLNGATSMRCSQESRQVLLAGQEGVQLYWCDWQKRVELRVVLRFSGDILFSMEKMSKGWLCLGEFGQYGTGNIRLRSCEPAGQNHPNCFIGGVQYILTPESLLVLNHHTHTLTRLQPIQISSQVQSVHVSGVNFKEAVLLKVGKTLWRVGKTGAEWGVEGRGQMILSHQLVGWRQGIKVNWWQVENDGITWLCEGECQGELFGAFLKQHTVYQLTYLMKQFHLQQIPIPTREVEVSSFTHLETFNNHNLGHIISQLPSNCSELSQPLQEEEKYNEDEPIRQSEPEPYPNNYLEPASELQPQFPSLGQSAISLRSHSRRHTMTNKPLRISGFAPAVQSGILDELQPVSRTQSQLQIETPMFTSPKDFNALDGGDWFIPSAQPITEQVQDMERSSRPSGDNVSSRRTSGREIDQVKQVEADDGIWVEECDSDVEEDEEVLQQMNFSQIEGQTIFKPLPTSAQQVRSSMSRLTKCHILNQLHRSDPDKFQETLHEAMPQLIQQPEARMFLAEHIPTSNPQVCRDRILRLFHYVPDIPDNRKLMATALAEFRLEEVPISILPFSNDFSQIFMTLWPKVYMQDLITPSLKLYDGLCEAYLSTEMKKSKLYIEGQCIQLGPARNLLNILLYLNQVCALPMQGIFQVYGRRLMRSGHVSTLVGLVERGVLTMCELEEDFLSKLADGVMREWVEEQGVDSKDLETLLELMTAHQRRRYEEILNLMDCFNICGLKYKQFDLLSLQKSPSILPFFDDLIAENEPLALASISIPSVLTTIYRLRTGRSPRVYSPQQLSVTRMIAQNSMKGHCLSEAINALLPIAPAVSRGFMAKLLFDHMEGRYANRLARLSTPLSSSLIEQTFPEMLSLWQADTNGDEQPKHVLSDMQMTWQSFKKICQERLKARWELAYILFVDMELAYELVQEEVISVNDFYYLQEILGHSTLELKKMRMKKAEERAVVMFESDSQERSGQQEQINQSYLPQPSHSSTKQAQRKKEKLKQHSLRGLTLSEPLESCLLTKSAAKAEPQEQSDPTLIMLKLQVERESILSMLKEVYETQSHQKFQKAVSVVDRQRVGLTYWQTFKSMSCSGIQYPIQRLIPFEYLLSGPGSWLQARCLFSQNLTHDNFWVLYMIADIAFGRGPEAVLLFIERAIKYLREDKWAPAINQIIKKVTVDKQKLAQLRQEAEYHGLEQINRVLMV